MLRAATRLPRRPRTYEMPRLSAWLIALFLISGPGVAQDLRVYHIDVSQGDGTLIIGPTGIACLIDAGDVGHGLSDVVPLLNQLGVTQLKWTIVTHYHSDHYGAIPEIVGAGFLPQTAAYDRGTSNQPTGSLFSQYLVAVGAKRATMTVGTVLDLGGGATLTCVGGNGVALGGASVTIPGTSQEENSRSLALKLAYGNYHEAICGDLTGGGSGTANVESVVGPVMGNVDVYKVNHHGSFTSSNPAFVGALAPEVCSISCGDGNPYGHPHQSVLDTLLAEPSVVMVYRINQGDPSSIGGTVVGGTLAVQTNGQSYTCTGPMITPLALTVDEGGAPPPSGLQPGDVVVSEYMNNPAAVADAVGEWFELRNTTPASIDLVGCTVRDLGIDQFVVPSLVVPAYGFVTLAVNGNPAQNGGFTPSYVWPASTMFLANSADELEIRSPQGVVLDFIAWGSGTGMPSLSGASIEREDATAPSWPTNFSLALPAATFGAGDRGTPGALNSQDHTPPFAALASAGSNVPGGIMTLTMLASGTAGKPYQLALSHAQAPPIVLPTDGRVIEIAPGWLLDFSLVPNNGVTFGFAGAMNALGYGFGTIVLPPEPAISGLTFFAVGVVIDAAYPSGIGSIAPSIALTIQ
jgi:beta-lactamase superfamily II metal-dependent hydrolase